MGVLGWWEDVKSLWTQFIDGEVESVCKDDIRKHSHSWVLRLDIDLNSEQMKI